MKRFRILFLSIFSIIVLSACSFQEDKKLPNILLTTSGILKENNSFFSSYSLYSERGNELSISSSDNSIDLDKFTGKEVIIRGFINPNERKDDGLQTNKNVIDLSLLEIELLDKSWKKQKFSALNLELKIPFFISFEKDEKGLLINFKKNNSPFFLIKKFKEGKQQALRNGEKVLIGDLELYRYFSGNQKIFYSLENDIQIEYWGEDIDIPLFYSIIEGLSFIKKGGLENNENESKKYVKESIENKKFLSHPSSLKTSPVLSQTPPLRVIVKSILSELSQPSSLLFPSSGDFYIQRIEVLDSLVSVEYREVISQKAYKTLFFAEWKSIFLEELFFHHLAFFSEGKHELWKKEEGNIPEISDKYSFFLSNIKDRYVINRPKDFIWYFSSHYKFTIGIPKTAKIKIFTKEMIQNLKREKYILKPFEKKEEVIKEKEVLREKLKKMEIIEFITFDIPEHKKLFPHQETNNVDISDIPDISLFIVKNSIEKRKEFFNENIILLPKSETAHFVLIGNKSISFSLLQKMSDTLILH